MDADTPEMVEAVARALCLEDGRMGDTEAVEQQRVNADWRGYIPAAHTAIAAARPFILEEAARVADEHAAHFALGKASMKSMQERVICHDKNEVAKNIAQAIRSLSKDGEGLDDR